MRFGSYNEVTQLTGLSRSTIKRLCRDRSEQSLPRIRVRGRVLFPLDAVESWLAARVEGGTIGGEA